MPLSQAEFFDSVGKIAVFLLLLFAVFLLTAKVKKKLPNRIFAAFLLVVAFDFSGLFLINFFAENDFIQNVKVAAALLQMPLFFLYVRAVCYSNFRFRSQDLLHALPFLVFLAVFVFEILPKQSAAIYDVAGEVQYFAYVTAIFWVLKRHRIVYLENFSNPDYTAYKWLFQATVLFLIAHTFVLVRSVLRYFGTNPEWYAILNIVVVSMALLVICWLVMKAMYKPQIFLGVENQLEPTKRQTIQKEKTPENSEQILQLKKVMETEKPFLDAELSLQKLALLTQMEEKELSLLINQKTGKHFFDFVNEYRIEEAKSLLKNPEKSELTILEILYAVGFNSKSSFYTAFKKQVGQTPVAYRKTGG